MDEIVRYSSAKYERICKIGEGSYGEVFKARRKYGNRNEFVAMKRDSFFDGENVLESTIKEITFLKRFHHRNVVKMIETCILDSDTEKPDLYVVMEYCERDLASSLEGSPLSTEEKRSYMRDILSGLAYVHDRNVIHRDLKPQNLLVTRNGFVKLADFGMAREITSAANDAPCQHTNQVCTTWYRAPELCLGHTAYGKPIDLWSLGLIMTELWTRAPIMQGDNDKDQLILISKLCGSITSEVWSDVAELPLFGKMFLPQKQPRQLKELLEKVGIEALGIDLIDRMLVLDPRLRIDARSALDHSFFEASSRPQPSKRRRLR